MNFVPTVIVVVFFVVATSIWIGGLVVLTVVAQVTRRTLSTRDRIATFRRLGRLYGPLGGSALVIAIVLGIVLLGTNLNNGLFVATSAVTACLVVVTILGVLQARLMTRMRSQAHDRRPDAADNRAKHGQSQATTLRITIGVLTLALIVLGSILVVSTA